MWHKLASLQYEWVCPLQSCSILAVSDLWQQSSWI